MFWRVLVFFYRIKQQIKAAFYKIKWASCLNGASWLNFDKRKAVSSKSLVHLMKSGTILLMDRNGKLPFQNFSMT